MMMGKHIYTIVLSLLVCMWAAPAHAQDYVNTPVEISKEKVKVDGKICYSHIVLERQTLYSISKAYGVSLEDIYRFNPSIKENGLKKNSIIIIPSQDALAAKTDAPKAAKATSPQESSKVKQTPAQQTIDKPEQKQQTETAVQKQQIETTAQKISAEMRAAPAAQERAQRIHIAKWYEDLDVIADQYGVNVEDIMKANNLSGRKLNKRHKLIIPYPGEAPIKAEPAVQVENNALAKVTDAIKEAVEALDSVMSYNSRSEVNATILMPLTDAEGNPSRNNMDFYCGALLAVYDMAIEGTGCKLNVHDVNSENQLSRETLSGRDMIIGPVSTADITRLLNVTGDGTLTISPLDPRVEKLVSSHSTLVQIPTPQQMQYRDLVKWMEEDFKEGDRAVMITEKGARQAGVSACIKEALDSSSLAYNPFSYSILEGRDVTEALTGLMSLEGSNRIIIASESEAFVNDVIRNLNLLIYNNIDIVLYAPSKIRAFETIEVDNLHKTSMHVSLAYYIDYEDQRVKDFLKKYRALYNTEPNQFAFQGYDVTRYFIELYSKYGEKWAEKIEDTDMEMLQSTFNIRRLPVGGYVNNGLRRIIYDNGYTVRKLK